MNKGIYRFSKITTKSNISPIYLKKSSIVRDSIDYRCFLSADSIVKQNKKIIRFSLREENIKNIYLSVPHISLPSVTCHLSTVNCPPREPLLSRSLSLSL